MSGLFESLIGQLGGDNMKQLSGLLGTQDEGSTKNAVSGGLAALLGGIQRNAQKPGGAEALHQALQRDHDGSALDNMGAMLNNPQQGNGAGILKHVLGGRRGQVEAAIGQSAGVPQEKMGSLMEALAPMVMGQLGKEQRSGGMDASNLAGFLNQQQPPAEAAPGLGMIGKLLDADGDGDVDLGDLAKAGMKLFKR